MSFRRRITLLLASTAVAASAIAAAPADAQAPAQPPPQATPQATPQGAPQVDSSRIITVLPGFRLQVRYAYDNRDGNNDFFIARTRLKAKGKVFGMADYYGEIKVDNVGRFGRTASAQVENAWLAFPLRPDFAVRIGLYDAVFSRNALTSDSKLLLMDRSLIKDELTTIGLADNTVGVLVHGRPLGGHAEYSAGVFDNLAFDEAGTPTARQADGVMMMGRFVWHLLDPAPHGGYADYQSSYLGQGRRLSIGLNAGYLPDARQGDEFDIKAWGADLFFNRNALTIEGEFDEYVEQKRAKLNIDGTGWYLQSGYLLHPTFELAARYQELDIDDVGGLFANSHRWTSVGVNVYMRGHSLKMQTDYTFKREQLNPIRNDGLQMQLQFDF
jgi:phosphate-selective porin O/P